MLGSICLSKTPGLGRDGPRPDLEKFQWSPDAKSQLIGKDPDAGKE